MNDHSPSTDPEWERKNQMRLNIMDIVFEQVPGIRSTVGWPDEKGVWKVNFGGEITRNDVDKVDYMIRGLGLEVDQERVHSITRLSAIWLRPRASTYTGGRTPPPGPRTKADPKTGKSENRKRR